MEGLILPSVVQARMERLVLLSLSAGKAIGSGLLLGDTAVSALECAFTKFSESRIK